MAEFILSILAAIRAFLRSRGDTALEVLALRQQIEVLKRKRPRPRLNRLDRLFWTTLRELWSRWTDVLVIVKPESVIRWHRAGFRLYFVIAHGRRKIRHFNVTRNPTAEWVVQQLREVFPEAGPYRYAIFDRDSKFDTDVVDFLKATGLKPKRTSVQAPWQNGIPERWIGSCRREILDHVIALNEQHLRRLIRDYVNYHHPDRIHHALDKDTPNCRPVEQKPSPEATVISSPRLGGLYHRYNWREAA